MFKFVAISNFYSLTFLLFDVKNFLKVFFKSFFNIRFLKNVVLVFFPEDFFYSIISFILCQEVFGIFLRNIQFYKLEVFYSIKTVFILTPSIIFVNTFIIFFVFFLTLSFVKVFIVRIIVI